MTASQGANPMGLDGIEFIEFAAPDPQALGAYFERLGFARLARHRSKEVLLYRQGEANFIINAERDSFPQTPAREGQASISAVAFRVVSAAEAYRQALAQGAWEVPTQAGVMELHIPGVQGLGETLIYFVDRYGDGSIYEIDFRALPGADWSPPGIGLRSVEWLAGTVQPGRMQQWLDFHADIFGFREIAFGGQGKRRFLVSPCGKIRLALAASAPVASGATAGEGLSGVALGAADIDLAAQAMALRGIQPAAPGSPARRLLSSFDNIQFEIVAAGSAPIA